MEIDEVEFQKIKDKAHKGYLEIEKVYCPYFKKDVVFDVDGFGHIQFKDLEHIRPRQDQVVRFKLLKYVSGILKLSGTVQGVSQANEWKRLKSHGVWVNKLKQSTYYEFISVVNDSRIKVVVKSDEEGNKFFWSVIPFWRINNNTSRRILHNINPEE